MAGFSRPTRAALVNRAVQDVEAELQNGAALIRRTLERAVAVAMGGLAHGLHGHLEWGARQLVIDRADDDVLVRWAEIFLGENARKAATKASFTIEVTGDAEVAIPEGTRWTRPDGIVFESTADAELPADEPYEVLVPVQAVDAGNDANTIPGTTLTIESPIADVEAAAVVQGDETTAIGGGTDIERIEDLRARLLEHLQTPPRAGSAGDYVRWAKEVAGVTRAWELPRQLGPSTVLVLVAADTYDDDGYFDETVLPDGDQVDEVQAYLEARANVTAIVTVQAPTLEELDPAVQIMPNTADVQAAVTAQLQDMLLRQQGPTAGGWTLRRNEVIQAIGLANGLDYFVLTSPAADVELDATQLVTLGTPVYTEAS